MTAGSLPTGWSRMIRAACTSRLRGQCHPAEKRGRRLRDAGVRPAPLVAGHALGRGRRIPLYHREPTTPPGAVPRRRGLAAKALRAVPDPHRRPAGPAAVTCYHGGERYRFLPFCEEDLIVSALVLRARSGGLRWTGWFASSSRRLRRARRTIGRSRAFRFSPCTSPRCGTARSGST